MFMFEKNSGDWSPKKPRLINASRYVLALIFIFLCLSIVTFPYLPDAILFPAILIEAALIFVILPILFVFLNSKGHFG